MGPWSLAFRHFKTPFLSINRLGLSAFRKGTAAPELLAGIRAFSGGAAFHEGTAFWAGAGLVLLVGNRRCEGFLGRFGCWRGKAAVAGSQVLHMKLVGGAGGIEPGRLNRIMHVLHLLFGKMMGAELLDVILALPDAAYIGWHFGFERSVAGEGYQGVDLVFGEVQQCA